MHPDQVGPYVIEKKIGAGGMGNVYLGVHDDTGQEAAVKVLPASMAREEGFVLRFSREIEALRKLSSEHIVKLFEDGQTEDGSYYYSMEYVEGETLTSMISRRKRIPWQEVVEITLEIATALKAAHNEGIIHRDLKPSNLMVRTDGHIKLTDFGVARVFATTRLTRTGGVVGTAEYMSPEQARGKQATRQSDLYSMGAVMYVMLTGRPPFTGKMASDILHQHQFSQFDRPSSYVPEIPRLLEEYVCRLLEKKPESRYPDALVAIKQLQNVRSRIEYERDAQAAEDAELSSTASDRTVGGTSDKTRVSDAGPQVLENRPGPATIVRDLIREDIAQQMRKTPVERFFDNTYVLLVLFGLLVFTAWYLLSGNGVDPRAEFAKAEALMQQEAGSSWLRARDILDDLVDNEAMAEQQGQIQNWITQVDHYEFCRRLKVDAPTDDSAESEIQRLVSQATKAFADKRVAEARSQLQAVQMIIRGDADYEYLSSFIRDTLAEWDSQTDKAAPRLLLRDIISKAEGLLADDPDSARARELLQAGIALYADEASVAEEIATCRRLLGPPSSSP
ncbi:MAG: serine/threonine protein kinase [Planctomycetaceae bacterium]|nr:serine/threonine protein kinase [Planctomycetaceae bacterium]